MKSWDWVICGKHPGLKDYFHLGPNLPMVTALAEWIEKGFRGVGKPKTTPTELLSWRFWAGGPDRHSLLCGILKDSSDSVGRPYPMLIAGSGSLADWGARWDLVPQACEQSWSQMESLSARGFRHLKQLEDDLRRMREPQPLWMEFARAGAQGGPNEASSHDGFGAGGGDSIEGQATARARDSEILVALDGSPSLDPVLLIQQWHASLKQCHPDPPKAVFMGGNARASRLAVFRRPLTSQDFMKLWSI